MKFHCLILFIAWLVYTINMYSNMKYYENICNCLRAIQQNINRKLKSANCWQRTSLMPNVAYMCYMTMSATFDLNTNSDPVFYLASKS